MHYILCWYLAEAAACDTDVDALTVPFSCYWDIDGSSSRADDCVLFLVSSQGIFIIHNLPLCKADFTVRYHRMS